MLRCSCYFWHHVNSWHERVILEAPDIYSRYDITMPTVFSTLFDLRQGYNYPPSETAVAAALLLTLPGWFQPNVSGQYKQIVCYSSGGQVHESHWVRLYFNYSLSSSNSHSLIISNDECCGNNFLDSVKSLLCMSTLHINSWREILEHDRRYCYYLSVLRHSFTTLHGKNLYVFQVYCSCATCYKNYGKIKAVVILLSNKNSFIFPDPLGDSHRATKEVIHERQKRASNWMTFFLKWRKTPQSSVLSQQHLA